MIQTFQDVLKSSLSRVYFFILFIIDFQAFLVLTLNSWLEIVRCYLLYFLLLTLHDD